MSDAGAGRTILLAQLWPIPFATQFEALPIGH
jgi:hypothetical protein